MYDRIRQAINERDALARNLGIVVEQLGPDEARVTMPFDERHQNGWQRVHGGASFTLADIAFTALAQASNVRTRKLNSGISYCAPGMAGPLTAVSTLDSASGSLCHITVRVTDGRGTLIVLMHADGQRTGEPFLPDDPDLPSAMQKNLP